MIISDPLKMRIHAFGDAAFSLLKEQFEDRAPIRIGNKEFIATNATRNFDGEKTTECSSEISEFVRIKIGEWNGEGLPPIGIDVEVFADYSHPRFDRFIGQQVHIVAHDEINGDPVAVFRMPVDGNYTEQDYHAMVAGSFRPIRTPEQIAAEEMAMGVRDMRQVMAEAGGGIDAELEALWLAGYRKFEIVDN